MAITVSMILALVAYSQLSDIWFGQISGLSKELADFAVLPTKILAFIPAFAVLLSFQRSIMVTTNNTRPITGATITEVALITFILTISIYYFNLPGAVGAALAMVLGRFGGNVFLLIPNLRVIHNLSER